MKEIRIAGKIEPKQLFYDNSNKNFKTLINEINKEGINGIILFGQPSASCLFIQQLRQKNMNQPVFGTLSMLREGEFDNPELANYDNVTVVTSGDWFGSKQLSFQNEYLKKYDKMPGAVSAYAFDGMNIIIEAIKHSGLDREKIQGAMSKSHFKGVTGYIQFDEKGNRIAAAQLIELNNGILAAFEK